MNQPRRFKAAPAPGFEGRLMALGSEEMPESEAMGRVARSLGISAAMLASTAVTTTLASTATAATSVGGGVGTAGAAAGKLTGSFLATTLFKATVIGLGLGVASYASTKVVRSRLSADSSNKPSVLATVHESARKNPNNDAIAREGSILRDPVPETADARNAFNSQAATGSAPFAAQRTVPSDPLSIPAPAPVGRFDDLESPATVAGSVQGPTESLAGQTPGASAPAASNMGSMPVDPRLAREVASLDRARAFAARGDPTGALREIDHFQRSSGYFALKKEAMLVNIDVLLSLGQKVEAAAIARQLLALGAPVTQRAKLEELIRGQSTRQ